LVVARQSTKPLPTVAPEMKAAVLQWIREGAPETAATADQNG
jgi:hypothetical protein